MHNHKVLENDIDVNEIFRLSRVAGFTRLSLKVGIWSNLKFEPAQATATVARHLDHPLLLYFVYPLGIVASCYHLANGFWTAAITWGLTVSKGGQRRWGYACGVLFFVLLTWGIAALIGGARADPHLLTASVR